jgi:hypothetical protein
LNLMAWFKSKEQQAGDTIREKRAAAEAELADADRQLREKALPRPFRPIGSR